VDKTPTSKSITTKEPLNGSHYGHHTKNIRIISAISADSLGISDGIALNILAPIAEKPVVTNQRNVPSDLGNTMAEILKSDTSESNHTLLTQTYSSDSQNTQASKTMQIMNPPLQTAVRGRGCPQPYMRMTTRPHRNRQQRNTYYP
jgi:hypothetical protein